MGDNRVYGYVSHPGSPFCACGADSRQIIVLRAVTTTDFMTAEAYNFPWDFLQRVMNRIVNEVHGYVVIRLSFSS
jgi:GMP synthase (glutamine-hydrolysing)